jgi:hypothetical protein
MPEHRAAKQLHSFGKENGGLRGLRKQNMDEHRAMKRDALEEAMREVFTVKQEKMFQWCVDEVLSRTGPTPEDIKLSVAWLVRSGDLRSKKYYMTLKKGYRVPAQTAEEKKQVLACIKHQRQAGQL